MKAVIFHIENAVFKFSRKEVRDHLRRKKAEYAFDEVSQLLELIATDRDETNLNLDDHNYFGYVVLELIGSGEGIVICKLCDETYGDGQLKEFAIGHGNSPFNLNQEQKGGFSLFEKRKNPSMFGGKGFKCPEGHKLISMETWKT